ncbi:C2 domain-containing protein At1g53590-like [Rutidosis leptorrhynchoides]|uniref:C2 domain-containing protein At1g53590-like n=1 Tax=Rutidosis leptorrhynchoides TaxID=125765 RepID=UPI003A99796E
MLNESFWWGIKFLPRWPFLGLLRVCFVKPPYFRMTIKSILTHALDVAEVPEIVGLLDKLLQVAFEETLVEGFIFYFFDEEM